MQERLEGAELKMAAVMQAEEVREKEAQGEMRERERLMKLLADRNRDAAELRERMRELEEELERRNEVIEQQHLHMREEKRREEQAQAAELLQGMLGKVEKEKERLREELKEREEEVKQWKSRVEVMDGQSGRPQSDSSRRREGGTAETHGGIDDTAYSVSVEGLREQVTTLLVEREERDALLKERDSEVYALKRRVDDLGKDRARLTTALELTEAALVRYKEKSWQLEMNRGSRSDSLSHTQEQEQERDEVQHSDRPAGGAEEQARLQAMQRFVAQLEVEQQELLGRNSRLEQRVTRLREERTKLREMIVQLEQGRQSCLLQLSQSDSTARESSRAQEAPVRTDEEVELQFLRARVLELEEQVRRLREALASDHRERAEFIEQSSRNNQRLLALRLDLNDSLAVVSQRPLSSVFEAETQQLDRSLREEEFH
ncbi:hypothetical protein GJAV_G00211350 [Gymnothorax javanicus]|nr:hypothetical protein GJAV_G00211350 [Gymnothorax javanicus]